MTLPLSFRIPRWWAHTVVTTYYGRSNAEASQLLQNVLDAKRVLRSDNTSEAIVRDAFSQAGGVNGDGWDGYYASIAIEEGVNTGSSMVDDFDRFDAFETNVRLSPEQFSKLNEYRED